MTMWAIVLDGYDPVEGLRQTLAVYGPYDQVEVVGELERVINWMASESYAATFPHHIEPGAQPFKLQSQGVPATVTELDSVRKGPRRLATVESVDPPLHELWDRIKDTISPGEVLTAARMCPEPMIIPDDVQRQIIANRRSLGLVDGL